MVLENVEESITDPISGNLLEKKCHEMLFVRGDCVIMVANQK